MRKGALPRDEMLELSGTPVTDTQTLHLIFALKHENMWIPVLCHKDLIPPAQMCYVPAALGLKAQQERSEMQF